MLFYLQDHEVESDEELDGIRSNFSRRYSKAATKKHTTNVITASKTHFLPEFA